MIYSILCAVRLITGTSMLETPDAIIFAARQDVDNAISKLRHTKHEAELTSAHTLELEQLMHDLWETRKRMLYLEDEV
jgi:hypothetical protein